MSLIRKRTNPSPERGRGVRLVCTALLLFLSGCTLSVLAMMVDEPVCLTCPADTKFSNAIDIGSVTGGKPNRFMNDSNVDDDALRDVLARSLASNKFLSAAPGLGAYVLDVHIVEGPDPRGNFVTNANAAIRYAVDKKATGERVVDELIHTSATLTVSQVPLEPERSARVVQMLVKKNITEFLSRLAGRFEPFPVAPKAPPAEDETNAAK